MFGNSREKYEENARKNLITTRSKVIVLATISFVMSYVFAYLISPHDVWWKDYFKRPVSEIVQELLFSMLFSILVSIGSIFIHGRLNLLVPWIERPRKRLLMETLLNILLVVLLILLMIFSASLLPQQSQEDFGVADDMVGYLQWVMVSVFIALVISAIHTGDYLITNWKNAALEATEHKLKSAQHRQAAAEAELQALKLQLDPHFVFNNLSVLSELILEDQQLGYQYSENLAKVYRYLLVNSRKNLITLEEELKFLKAYIFLLQHRAGSGLTFEIEIEPEHIFLQLPPLTLQLLIENAMKHNKLLKSNPLRILIRSGARELIVSNNLVPVEKSGFSSGLGLKNIFQRYELLSGSYPLVTQVNNQFVVTIPLIQG